MTNASLEITICAEFIKLVRAFFKRCWARYWGTGFDDGISLDVGSRRK